MLESQKEDQNIAFHKHFQVYMFGFEIEFQIHMK